MTVGSLFSGIGGFDLGFERAGFEIQWQVEIDDYCNRVLEKHWPNVRRFRDVREVTGFEWLGGHYLPPVDVIVGGFPCQDVSYANPSGKGLDGPRSGLWMEMRRIVCELRPNYVVVENVAALLDRGLGRVLGDLAAAGYDAEWRCVRACDFGFNHRRRRVFIVAYRAGVDGEETRQNLYPMAGRPPRQPRGILGASTSRTGPATDQPAFIGVADGVSDYVDRATALGNAIVPQIAEWIARRINEAESVAKQSERV